MGCGIQQPLWMDSYAEIQDACGPSVALEHVTPFFSGFQLTYDLGGDVEKYLGIKNASGNGTWECTLLDPIPIDSG